MPNPFPAARDPILSLFQSAAAAVARRLHPPGVSGVTHPLPQAAGAIVANRASAVADAPLADPAAGLGCAGLGLLLLRALAAGDTARVRALRDRLGFSGCDPLWAETLFDYARLYLPDGTPPPIPYRAHQALSDFVVPAPRSRMRVALISDWGTGTRQAQRVAALLAAQQPDAVIHLGDIYFSGTREECAQHFLAPLRAVLPDQPLFTLCGNHDVYSGGHGYYDLLRQIGQPASYFCLRSPDGAWQILAGDTGLHDRNPFDETAALTWLEPSEVAWHAHKLRGFAGRTILLTHHQPFSAYRQIGPAALHSPVNANLMQAYATLAEAGRVDAWFWGHEHRLRLYGAYRGVAAGRNVGFGAVPVAAAAEAGAPMPGLVDPPGLSADVRLDVVDGAYTHGFVLLDLSQAGIEASYWALTRPDGPIHREVLGVVA